VGTRITRLESNLKFEDHDHRGKSRAVDPPTASGGSHLLFVPRSGQTLKLGPVYGEHRAIQLRRSPQLTDASAGGPLLGSNPPAMVLRLHGYGAWIESDGKPLEEYAVEVKGSVISCYVCSEEGKVRSHP